MGGQGSDGGSPPPSPPILGNPGVQEKTLPFPPFSTTDNASECPDGIGKPRRGRYQPIKKLEVADISVQGKFLNNLTIQKAMTNKVNLCHKLKNIANKCVNNVFRILIFKADISI